jgi:tetratricopeptide (TPR) repeat protein
LAQQTGQAAAPAAQGQQPKKQVKDQGEYDLFNSVLKATDPNEKLKLLTTWKEKYPASDFKDDRLVYFIQTYAQLGKYQEAISSAKELLAIDSKNITAMFYINNLTPVAYATNPPADALDQAEKAANGLLAAEMPANTKAEDWAKAKKGLDTAAHKTLGWVAWQRKNFDVAEQQFRQSLEMNPNDGEASYWLGSALLQSRKPDKQAPALFEIARAVMVDPAHGGLPDATRKQLEAYLTKTYTTYHGSTEGLDQLKEQAKASALPPANFEIKTGAQLEAEKEEEFKKANPSLALWMNLKKELQGPNGEQFFETTMKNANVPGGAGGITKLRGHLISAKPAANPTQLVIGMEKADVAEVTLKLETPVKGKPVPGSEVDFDGVPVSYTKDPFMVTFEQAKASGMKMEAPPARKAPAKKAGARKK